MCNKLFLNPIKINIKSMLWSSRLTLELELILILYLFSSVIFKSFRQSMTTCSYKTCSFTIFCSLFLTSVGVLKGSFVLFLQFFSIWGNVSFVKDLLLYNYFDCPPICFMMFVDIFNSIDVFNVNVQCLLICFCLLIFFKTNLHILAIFIYFTDLRSCYDVFLIFFSYCHLWNFRIFSIYLCFSQTSFQLIMNNFPFKKCIVI